MRLARLKRFATIVVFAAAIVVSRSAMAEEDRKPSASRPNVLFFFTDDQRTDTIHALGNKQIKTPNLDRLVERGTVLNRAYCMGAMHGAVCAPSRAMLLSGRSLFRVKDNLADTPTWPEQFSAAGYATFVSGKWHNGAASLVRAFDAGEAVFLGGMTDPYAAKVVDFARTDAAKRAKLTPPRTTEKHCVERFADAAIAFLQRQDSKQPFLCYVAFNAPHDPCIVPEDFAIKYDAAKLTLPGNFQPLHSFDNGELRVRDEKLLPWPRTEEQVRANLAAYYRAVSFVDSQIGRVLDELQRRGLAENTIVVFASDHGLAAGSHGLLGKQNLYEHSMRAPLILAGPGIRRAARTDALCYLFDIFPTLGELCGVAAPSENEGQSLRPVLVGDSQTARQEIFTAYRDVQRAIRDDRWKLIRYPKIDKTQLFDLKDDPDETRDLAGDARYRSHAQRLYERMQRAQSKYADSAPLAVESPSDGHWNPREER
jgi:arylsulfatase A-like enzyme